MKVLHIINNLQVGGAEVLLKNLAPRLREQGIEAEIAVLGHVESYIEKELAAQGFTVTSDIQASVYSARHIFPLMRRLRDFDVVHVHLFPAQLWTAAAKRLSRSPIPLLTTEHGTHNRRRKAWFRPLDRWMYAQYGTIVCASDAIADSLTAWVPQCARQVSVITNGIPLGRFSNVGEIENGDLPLVGPGPVVLSVGRLAPEKDQETLVRAMALVPDAHLILVGVGPLRQELGAIASSVGVADRVHFLGARQDVPELIQRADVYVQPSKWEGFGIAAVEAMAGGTPVVVSHIPGLSDVVGDAGVLFPAGDHRRLADSLKQLLQDPEQRRILAEKGRLRARLFSIENTARKYTALYRSLGTGAEDHVHPP